MVLVFILKTEYVRLCRLSGYCCGVSCVAIPTLRERCATEVSMQLARVSSGYQLTITSEAETTWQHKAAIVIGICDVQVARDESSMPCLLQSSRVSYRPTQPRLPPFWLARLRKVGGKHSSNSSKYLLIASFSSSSALLSRSVSGSVFLPTSA